tara:strand:+ start:407 stop:1048 length:642 start_codon:yes stop_codon:yes gene_type:complete
VIDVLALSWSGILLAYGVFIMGMFSPGPNILSIIGTSMSIGRKEGRSLALGIASGSLLWGLLAWAGLTTVLVAYASLMTLIKFAGALYLLWLAFKSFRSAASARQINAKALALDGNGFAYFRRGLLIQMTNPKAALTWTATVSLGLGADAPWWVGGIIVAGTTVISFAGHLAYALAFSTQPVIRAFAAARRWIETGLGAFFCFASYKLATSRL